MIGLGGPGALRAPAGLDPIPVPRSGQAKHTTKGVSARPILSDLSLRSSENGLEFRRHTSSLRTRVGWRVPTSSPGSASADGEDRLGGGDLELPEDVGELGTDGRGLNDGPALARVADGLEPLEQGD